MMCEVNRKGKGNGGKGQGGIEWEKGLLEQSAELPAENEVQRAMWSQHTAECKTARKSVEKSCCHKLAQSGHCPTLGFLLLFFV